MDLPGLANVTADDDGELDDGDNGDCIVQAKSY
jgi:hypothetical protein